MRINLSDRESIIWEHAKSIFSFVFQILLFLFLLTLLLREFYPAHVNSYVNINWFMLIVIVFGAFSILFPSAKQEEKIEDNKEVTRKDIALVIGLGILGAIIIYLKLKGLGWIGYVISALGGLIIILLSWLLLTEKDTHEDEFPLDPTD